MLEIAEYTDNLESNTSMNVRNVTINTNSHNNSSNSATHNNSSNSANNNYNSNQIKERDTSLVTLVMMTDNLISLVENIYKKINYRIRKNYECLYILPIHKINDMEVHAKFADHSTSKECYYINFEISVPLTKIIKKSYCEENHLKFYKKKIPWKNQSIEDRKKNIKCVLENLQYLKFNKTINKFVIENEKSSIQNSLAIEFTKYLHDIKNVECKYDACCVCFDLTTKNTYCCNGRICYACALKCKDCPLCRKKLMYYFMNKLSESEISYESDEFSHSYEFDNESSQSNEFNDSYESDDSYESYESE